MRVGGGNHIGTRDMDPRVDREGRGIHRILPLHHFATMIHENQVRGANLSEVHSEGIDPEMIGAFGIAGSDVSGYAFVESEARKKAEGSGEHLLAMPALFSGSGENRRAGNVQYIGGRLRHLSLPGSRLQCEGHCNLSRVWRGEKKKRGGSRAQ